MEYRNEFGFRVFHLRPDQIIHSSYRPMWLIAMFDLPVMTPLSRKRASRFRHVLLDAGFIMLQFSIYARFCESAEAITVKRQYVRMNLPPDGAIRMIAITDRQFAKMEHYQGHKRARSEETPDDLLLF